ncbi:MAG: extensin family protein [Hyphomicrobiaceae bacterium]
MADAKEAAERQGQTSQSAAAPASAPKGWSEAEIATARARCNAIIARYGATATPMEPIKDGECGTPAPVQLTGIGKVALSPAAVVNCEMIAAVGDWLKLDVQPTAKRLLGQRVKNIDVLSSYSCRNAYGRKRTRLSEHGRANALDIRGFDFERNAGVELLTDWGMTERDIKARIAAAERAAREMAAAKAKSEAEARAKAIATARNQPDRRITSPAPSIAESLAAQRGIGLIPSADGISALRGVVSGTIKGHDDDQPSSVFSLGQPSRLGGPKPRHETTRPPAATKPKSQAKVPTVDAHGHDARQRFLREIHDAACKRFGTVLGPEANEAHRNHFHVDLAERGGRGSFCE